MFGTFCQKHGIEKGSSGKHFALKERSSSGSGKIKIVCGSKGRPRLFQTAFSIFEKKGKNGRLQVLPGSSICSRGIRIKGYKIGTIGLGKFLKHKKSPLFTVVWRSGMGLDVVPRGYAFYFFKYFAEVKCTFKAQLICNLVDLIILF